MKSSRVGQDRFLFRSMRIALMAIACVTAFPAAGDDDAESRDPVVFSLADFKPWAQRTPDGGKRGLLVEMVREIHERTGLPVKAHVRPHGRALLELEDGIADFVPSWAAPGIDRIGKPVGHLVTARILVLGRAGDGPIQTLDALNGENVGYLDGTWYGQTFENNERIQKVPVKDVAHGVKLLERGRLKALICSEIALPAAYDPEAPDSNGLALLMELTRNDGKLYMSRKSDREQARKQIEQALESMHDDGTMDDLFANRFQSPARYSD